DFQPAFSADGQYLFFVSNRDYNLNFSDFEFNYVYDGASRVYVAALDAGAPALFPPRSDEEPVPTDDAESDTEEMKDAKSEKGGGDDDGGDETVVVDPDGFLVRTVALPGVGAANYGNLVATDGAVYFLRFAPGGPPTLERYDLGARKHETVAKGVQGFEVSRDGKKILYFGGGGWHLVDAKPGQDGKGRLDVSGLRTKIDPRAEWRQMFDDAWRITRDWFYDPNMHGMDWDALGERYRPLVDRIAHRSELDWILGELIGELGAGHTYVQSGEVVPVERIEGGSLGVEFEADGERYRIARIFEGENWTPRYRSPLTEPGVQVEAGEFLLAIDGEALTTADNPYRLLEGKANQQVTLTVNDQPSRDGARDIVVVTRGQERELRYIDWVKNRMAMVDRLSNGRIGYIHLPNTAVDGNRMLQKLFYGQTGKDALIVDDRYNGGGFIPDRMIEYFTRTNMARWAMRDIDAMQTPGFAHDGPKAMLMNGYSSSGGDALPYFFRQQGLGPLIGSRTWGGLIGLNGNPPLMDGGTVAICTFRIYDAEGHWVVENEGVEPDYEVFDVAESYHEDGDPSIEKAVEVLLDQLAKEPVTKPVVPTPPDLSRPER
ncbi:MAG: PDZ domain-containing protein, partial [Acidobacteriota bacterium]